MPTKWTLQMPKKLARTHNRVSSVMARGIKAARSCTRRFLSFHKDQPDERVEIYLGPVYMS